MEIDTHKIEHLALHDQLVQAPHNYLDGRHPVPPVDIQYIDVARAELAQARVDAHAHALEVVPTEVCLVRGWDLRRAAFEGGGVLLAL